MTSKYFASRVNLFLCIVSIYIEIITTTGPPNMFQSQIRIYNMSVLKPFEHYSCKKMCMCRILVFSYNDYLHVNKALNVRKVNLKHQCPKIFILKKLKAALEKVCFCWDFFFVIILV